MLMGFLGAFPSRRTFSRERVPERRSCHPMGQRALLAERLRGMTSSTHQAWVFDERRSSPACARNGEHLFRTFDAVICPIMPTPGLSA